MDAPDLALHCSTRCTTPTKERKLVESKLLAKPNLSTTANSPYENDGVINIDVYDIDSGWLPNRGPVNSGQFRWKCQDEGRILASQLMFTSGQTTTSMVTDVVAPSTEMVAEDFGSRNLTPEPVERVSRLGGGMMMMDKLEPRAVAESHVMRARRLTRAAMSSESFFMSHSEWNAFIHAMIGNTVKATGTTTTKTSATKTTPTTAKSILDPPKTPTPKPKAKAKAKAGPGRPRTVAAKSASKPTSKLSGAAVDKPPVKTAAKTATKKVQFQVPVASQKATFEFSSLFGTEPWGYHDDPATASALMIGRFVTNFPANDVRLDAVRQSITNIDNLMKELAAGKIEDDLDDGRDAWIKTVAGHLKQYEKQLNVQHAAAVADDDAPNDDEAAMLASGEGEKEEVEDMAYGGMFPGDGPKAHGLRTDYTYKPHDGPLSLKQPSPAVIAQKLKLNASQTEYRSWKYQILAYCQSCEEMRFTEASVRAAVFASLDAPLNSELTLYFGEKLGGTSVADTLRQLDIKFQHLAQHEDKFAVKQFVESTRRADESLQSWVDRYKSLYRRAAAAGYTPASDAADILMRKSSISAQAHGQFIGEFRAKETNLGRAMTPSEKHAETYAYLTRVAASMEQLKFDRDYLKKESAEKVNAAGSDSPKKRRGRSRKPAKKTTVPRDDVMTGDAAEAANPKRGAADAAGGAQPKKKPKHDDNSAPAEGPSSAPDSVLTAMTTAMHAMAGVMNGKGKGKGKGAYGSAPHGGKGAWTGGKNAWHAHPYGGKGGGKGRKGKGKGKVGFNTRPSPIPFAGYDPAKNDWKCKECGGFNYAQNVKCYFCSAQRPSD